MRESIYTIPLTEVFSPKDGCPMCKLENTIEERFLDYIMGGAMMEPSIRVATNKVGFCKDHLSSMFSAKNRLSLSLLLESHLMEIQANLDEIANGKNSYSDGCYVCSQIEEVMEKLASNVAVRYKSDLEFAKLFKEQPQLCLNHYTLFCGVAKKQLGKKYGNEFIAECKTLCNKTLDKRLTDLKSFIKTYDYRSTNNSNGIDDCVKNATKEVISFLTCEE